jgi:hypothetical protein
MILHVIDLFFFCETFGNTQRWIRKAIFWGQGKRLSCWKKQNQANPKQPIASNGKITAIEKSHYRDPTENEQSN